MFYMLVCKLVTMFLCLQLTWLLCTTIMIYELIISLSLSLYIYCRWPMWCASSIRLILIMLFACFLIFFPTTCTDRSFCSSFSLLHILFCNLFFGSSFLLHILFCIMLLTSWKLWYLLSKLIFITSYSK